MRAVLYFGAVINLLASPPAPAAPPPEQADVAFVVVGKTANYRQSAQMRHSLLNYHFFGEIFLQQNGRVDDPRLVLPETAGRAMAFEDGGYALEVHGGRYASERDVDRAYPAGKYVFAYTLSDGTEITQPVVLQNATGRSRIPGPVSIYLWQEEARVSPLDIDPGRDLVVTWSPFVAGNADPNGIVDDLLFVVTGDCHGQRVDHSGGPFGSGTYLTYAATQYTIPAAKLIPGEPMQISVEQAEMDTGTYQSIPDIATYAVTTFLDVRMRGASPPGRGACAASMPGMDRGQTDRPQRRKASDHGAAH